MADYNSIYTGAQIDAAIATANSALQSVSGTTDEVVVTGGDTISLATAVTDSLALADTATQPADIANMVESDPSAVSGADAITNIMSLTQSEYDAITPDAATFYIITG